jgi:hypothetical protein
MSNRSVCACVTLLLLARANSHFDRASAYLMAPSRLPFEPHLGFIDHNGDQCCLCHPSPLLLPALAPFILASSRGDCLFLGARIPRTYTGCLVISSLTAHGRRFSNMQLQISSRDVSTRDIGYLVSNSLATGRIDLCSESFSTETAVAVSLLSNVRSRGRCATPRMPSAQPPCTSEPLYNYRVSRSRPWRMAFVGFACVKACPPDRER